jgi:hypothetical protein
MSTTVADSGLDCGVRGVAEITVARHLDPAVGLAARQPRRWLGKAGFSPRAVLGHRGLIDIIMDYRTPWDAMRGCEKGLQKHYAHPKGNKSMLSSTRAVATASRNRCSGREGTHMMTRLLKDVLTVAGALCLPNTEWSYVQFPNSTCGDGTPAGLLISPGSQDLLLFMEGG